MENQLVRDKNPLFADARVRFQDERALPHSILAVKRWLDNEFPDIWIRQRGSIE